MSGASLVELAAAVYLCERSCDGGLLLWQLYNVSARPTPSKPAAPHPTTPVEKSWLRRLLWRSREEATRSLARSRSKYDSHH
eukprot:COSAG02_NODE_562_length_20293_cov_37.104288_9_plen_82_part_00